MDRVFLDAGILFSAAYREDSALGRFWRMRNVELVTSDHAIEEARRNLSVSRPVALARLDALVSRMTVVRTADSRTLGSHVDLHQKDRHILEAAVAAQATFLVTSDRRHFRHLWGAIVEGVVVLSPAMFLSGKQGDDE